MKAQRGEGAPFARCEKATGDQTNVHHGPDNKESTDEFAPLTTFAFDKVDDIGQRRPRRENLPNATFLERISVFGRNSPAAEKDDILRALRFELIDDERKERHVRAGEDGEPYSVGVFLNGGLHDLLGRLKEPGVDDFHACVTQGTRDHFRAAIVAV